MADYFAVIRLVRNDTPMRAEFSAQDVAGAMKELLRACGCTSSNELKEFELYEVLRSQAGLVGGYRPVASRIAPANVSTATGVLPAITAPTTAVLELEKLEQKMLSEKAYTPYSLIQD
jgi:hypothetical protein